jgi:hypothetical protein
MQPVLASRCYLPSRRTSSLRLVEKLAHSILEGWWVGTRDTVGHLAVLEEPERWNGLDTELRGELGDIVCVELRKDVLVGNGVVMSVLVENGPDGFAGAAPGCAGFDGDERRGSDEGFELAL